MPDRGQRSAPTFDQAKPYELYRFFEDLERLFVRVGVTADIDKKKDACRYVDVKVERVWKSFPEFADQTKNFAAFKAAIQKHYPDAEGDYLYSAIDLEKLISTQFAAGMQTVEQLQTFHLEFITISNWLIEKDLLGEIEQRRSYIHAFDNPLLGNMKARLRMLNLHQHPNKPYKMEEVFEAARFVLQDGEIFPQAAHPATPIPSASSPVYRPPVSNNMPVKAETFAQVMGDFSKTIADALLVTSRARISGPTPMQPRQTNCNFCGGEHFIRECPVVDEYIVAGKVRRNYEGKVVLSTGAFVPREIPGTLLSERVNEWHHRNPGQLGVATLVHTISAEHVRSRTQTTATSAFQLSATDRITALEAELFNLRARKSNFTPVVRTRAQRAREGPVEASIEEVPPDEPAPVPTRETTPEVRNVAPRAPIVPEAPVETRVDPLPFAAPVHPFRNARDAAYAPPVARNVGGIIKVVPKAPAGNTPAYRSLPPIHDPTVAADVYKRAMDAPITITQRELLSLSPEVRSQVREITTTRRIPTAPVADAQAALQVTFEDEDVPYDITPTFVLGRRERNPLPAGATIVSDPIESYYNSLEPGEEPDLDRLTVAKESTAIRSIHALIDTSQKKECTVDPGCQVVAMSEATCHGLALAYDPRIRLNMESANGTFDWSLGLARNVPFLIGTITLYLQVHVIRSPSYEVLLGRPFDVLTESVIRNYVNEDQTITITDPNTGIQCTIPTFARGTQCNHTRDKADF